VDRPTLALASNRIVRGHAEGRTVAALEEDRLSLLPCVSVHAILSGVQAVARGAVRSLDGNADVLDVVVRLLALKAERPAIL
jgi:hypothetical protein